MKESLSISPMVSPATSLNFTPHCRFCSAILRPDQLICFDCYHVRIKPYVNQPRSDNVHKK